MSSVKLVEQKRVVRTRVKAEGPTMAGREKIEDSDTSIDGWSLKDDDKFKKADDERNGWSLHDEKDKS